MAIEDDIIHGRMPDFDYYLSQGESLEDLDKYGFTPLIECVIARQLPIAEQLILRNVAVDATDSAGRTALYWAVDNDDTDMIQFLLKHGANPNAYSSASMPILVYPLLREHTSIKHMLYQYGAKLDFAGDFICGKLLGHRFELKGDVDIVNASGVFIELDYEGFILEFTVALLRDSLRRFTSNYSTRSLRDQFNYFYTIMDAFGDASELLKLQYIVKLGPPQFKIIERILQSPLLIFPVASRGHAIGFVKFHHWWAKIDRGENSLKEGSVNIYKITHPERIDARFLEEFLYKKQPREFFHQRINQHLGLIPMYSLPIKSQITGNCSWANMQAIVPVSLALLKLHETQRFPGDEVIDLYHTWVEWDQDRALDECIHRFYHANSKARQASLASMLADVLFYVCNYRNSHHLKWAEKILTILTLPDFHYILDSFVNIYCVEQLTNTGNNLLKILDDCGIDVNIDVRPVATDLKER